MKKRSIYAGLLILALLLGSCDQSFGPSAGKRSTAGSGTASLEMRLSMVDFANHLVPNLQGGRILDASAKRLRVTVTGLGIDAPIVRDVDITTLSDYWLDSSSTMGTSALKHTTVQIQDIPVGLDRRFAVEAFDAAGVKLAEGAGVYDVSLNASWTQGVVLHPVNCSDLALGIGITGVVPAGKTRYFRLPLDDSSDWVLVNLKSPGNLDLFASTPWNDWYWSWFQTAVVDEGVLLRNTDEWRRRQYGNYWYVAVYNAGATDSSFTLKAIPQEGRPLSGYSCQEVVPGAFRSVEGDPGVTALVPGNVNQYQVDLPFEFIYNGAAYNKLYVSPNGYVSFWRYSSWYDWWYWNDLLFWKTHPWYSYPGVSSSYFLSPGSTHWWNLGKGEYLPNELVALGKRPYFWVDTRFDPALPSDHSKDTKILVKKARVNHPLSGREVDEVTVEFRRLYAWYDSANPGSERYLTGQIVLRGNAFSDSYAGDIELRYDRLDSKLNGCTYFAGLENNIGEERRAGEEPEGGVPIEFYDSATAVPAKDLLYSSNHGGIVIGVE